MGYDGQHTRPGWGPVDYLRNDYAADLVAYEDITGYRFGEGYGWAALRSQTTGRTMPCHVLYERTGDWFYKKIVPDTMGPYAHDIPASILALCEQPAEGEGGGYADEWWQSARLNEHDMVRVMGPGA